VPIKKADSDGAEMNRRDDAARTETGPALAKGQAEDRNESRTIRHSSVQSGHWSGTRNTKRSRGGFERKRSCQERRRVD
jgi:hypothetical protein